MIDYNDESLICPICIERFDNFHVPMLFPCGHTFCSECVKNKHHVRSFGSGNMRCVIDRSEGLENVKPVVNNLLKKVVQAVDFYSNVGTQTKKRRRDLKRVNDRLAEQILNQEEKISKLEEIKATKRLDIEELNNQLEQYITEEQSMNAIKIEHQDPYELLKKLEDEAAALEKELKELQFQVFGEVKEEQAEQKPQKGKKGNSKKNKKVEEKALTKREKEEEKRILRKANRPDKSEEDEVVVVARMPQVYKSKHYNMFEALTDSESLEA